MQRENPLGVPMIDQRLRDKIFTESPRYTDQDVSQSKKELGKFNLDNPQVEKEPKFLEIPELEGKNLDEHWRYLGESMASPYKNLAKELAQLESLPPKPRKWLFDTGWTKYNSDGSTESVPYPDEGAIVFDVETAVKHSAYPVMACAVSSEAWYFWVSPIMVGGEDKFIPLGDSERVVVAHNASYDTARVEESYNLELNGTRYLDTLSLHTAVEGMSSNQRPFYLKIKKDKEQDQPTTFIPDWFNYTCMGGLKDLAKFHLGENLEKETRDIFVEGSLDEIERNFQSLANYNAKDVEITWKLFKVLFNKFLEKNPHPVSLAGVLMMSREILPTHPNIWQNFLSRCESAFQTKKKEVEANLKELADQAVQKWKEGEFDPDQDLWLCHLNWNLPSKRARKAKDKPQWYRGLLKKNQLHITPQTQVAPYLLRMKWEGYPLFHHKDRKWGYLVPINEDHVSKFDPIYLDENFTECDQWEAKYKYYRIPHKDGDNANVGSPLAKDYLSYFEKGILTSDLDEAQEAIENTIACSYWVATRDRVFNQFLHTREDGVGVIIPQLLTTGTITRRAVETTWLTASNPKPNKIGSEIKSTINAPEGYYIVGADVDSQELWLASVMGDSEYRLNGSTPFGMQNLIGDKKQKTDFHSNTAKIVNNAIERVIGEEKAKELDIYISRDDAKIFNYSRIYFAGIKSTTQQLKQIEKSLSDQEAQSAIASLFSSTKGNKLVDEWKGGTESKTFNFLEKVSDKSDPRTPLLGAGISDAIAPELDKDNQHKTTRGNWVVQSSGVDFLHCLIVATDYLCRKYEIDARLMISIHDEYRYLCKKEDTFRLAWAMQVAHIWTRAYVCYQLGIYDLPETVAWFGAIDVDFVLRKEVDTDLTTPSNPDPKVPNGKTIEIDDLIKKFG